MVTPALFARYSSPDDLAVADPSELEEIVRSTGFYASKAKNLIGMATALRDDFGGEVPVELAYLVTLPGVGRKTGNLVRVVAFGLPGVVVDTHVIRLSNRLGLAAGSDPVKIEHELARPPVGGRSRRLLTAVDPARSARVRCPSSCM